MPIFIFPTTGEPFCGATCNSIGRKDGTCVKKVSSSTSVSFETLFEDIMHVTLEVSNEMYSILHTHKESGESDCQCGGHLSPKQFALCAAESTCRLDKGDDDDADYDDVGDGDVSRDKGECST